MKEIKKKLRDLYTGRANQESWHIVQTRDRFNVVVKIDDTLKVLAELNIAIQTLEDLLSKDEVYKLRKEMKTYLVSTDLAKGVEELIKL